MNTNQIMIRPFMDSNVKQRTKDGFFFATSLLEVFNSNSEHKKRFKDFWENKGTQDFMQELENELITNGRESAYLKIYETTRGNNGGTWMHPYLFMKFACWLSPKFELQMIKWVYDNLIDFRNQAGDHYKKMCEVIGNKYFELTGNKADPLIFSKEARFLNFLCYNNYDGGKRNTLSEKQLQLLNELQLLNIELIKSQQYNKDQRKRILEQHAFTFKLINK